MTGCCESEEGDPSNATDSLFVVLLGGKHAHARLEVHDIAFARGHLLNDCHAQLRAQWFGQARGLHIDAWMRVDGVDGYRIGFSNRPSEQTESKLYFVHLGGYDSQRFGEEHGYALIVASSVSQARAQAKRRYALHWLKPHTDAVLDVDACIAIERVGDAYIHLNAEPHDPVEFANTYEVVA